MKGPPSLQRSPVLILVTRHESRKGEAFKTPHFFPSFSREKGRKREKETSKAVTCTTKNHSCQAKQLGDTVRRAFPIFDSFSPLSLFPHTSLYVSHVRALQYFYYNQNCHQTNPPTTPTNTSTTKTGDLGMDDNDGFISAMFKSLYVEQSKSIWSAQWEENMFSLDNTTRTESLSL